MQSQYVERQNVIREKSYAFALEIVHLSRQLMEERKEYVLSKQILKSGTSIGANVEEATQAQSRADFVSKLSIALKEAFETNYWLRLLRDSQLLSIEQATDLLSKVTELQRLLTAILKTSRSSS